MFAILMTTHPISQRNTSPGKEERGGSRILCWNQKEGKQVFHPSPCPWLERGVSAFPKRTWQRPRDEGSQGAIGPEKEPGGAVAGLCQGWGVLHNDTELGTVGNSLAQESRGCGCDSLLPPPVNSPSSLCGWVLILSFPNYEMELIWQP